MSLVRRHSVAATGLLAATSVMVALLGTEIALRVVGYRFSPIVFVRPDNADDHRPYHMGGPDQRIRANPLTVLDPDLLWRMDPRSSVELGPEGFRGPPLPARRPQGVRLILMLGDSNTLGPLGTADHWPGFLQDLLNANSAPGSFQVVNAGVYGYTSFQGLRLFRQVRRYRPDVVYFSFGANDAQPVRTTDEIYADRLDAVRRWNSMRLAPPLFHLAWRVSDAVRGAPLTFRVPLAQYRRNLEAFVGEARRDGILPVLVTRPLAGSSQDPATLLHYAPTYNDVVREVAAAAGVPLLDAFAILLREPEHFTDAIHNDRIGYRHLAEAALCQLHELGIVATDDRRDLASSLDLAAADERRLELGSGFWLREPWPDSPGGRWTTADATITLARRDDAHALLVDLSCYHPRGETRGRIEVDARAVALLPSANGRHRLRLELNSGLGRRVDVRVVVDSAYRPSDLDASSRDSRLLGVFLHEVRQER